MRLKAQGFDLGSQVKYSILSHKVSVSNTEKKLELTLQRMGNASTDAAYEEQFEIAVKLEAKLAALSK